MGIHWKSTCIIFYFFSSPRNVAPTSDYIFNGVLSVQLTAVSVLAPLGDIGASQSHTEARHASGVRTHHGLSIRVGQAHVMDTAVHHACEDSI